MSPEQLASVILGIVGVVLALVFRYSAKAQEWFDKQPNKGLLMLGFVVVAGGGYFGLSCTPWGAQLGISLSCDQVGVFALLKALFFLASGNQLAYLYTRPNAAAG